jgi:hypothetical protein
VAGNHTRLAAGAAVEVHYHCPAMIYFSGVTHGLRPLDFLILPPLFCGH